MERTFEIRSNLEKALNSPDVTVSDQSTQFMILIPESCFASWPSSQCFMFACPFWLLLGCTVIISKHKQTNKQKGHLKTISVNHLRMNNPRAHIFELLVLAGNVFGAVQLLSHLIFTRLWHKNSPML